MNNNFIKAIPLQKLTGITPDIGVLLRFHYDEKVYFSVNDPSFPSDLSEDIGYFVGIAENVGKNLTYKILMIDQLFNRRRFRKNLMFFQKELGHYNGSKVHLGLKSKAVPIH